MTGDALPIEITTLAARHIREAIANHPNAGGRAAGVKLANVRRVYLSRVKYHVYYRVIHSPARVQVVAFWHARRGQGPPI